MRYGLAIGLLCCAVAACDPASNDAGGASADGFHSRPTNVFFDESVDCTDPPADPGPAYVRRLTNEEYVNTVEDVLGVDVSDLRARLPKDLYVDGFKNTATALAVSGRRAEQYAALARRVAGRVDPGWLAARATCRLGERSCEQTFVRDVGLRLFRRPLTQDEVDRFARLFRVVQSQGDDYERAQRLVIEAMVQAPQFLYRLEADFPQTELPTRALGVDDFQAVGPGRVAHKLVLAAGRYRLSVNAGVAGGAKPQAVVARLDDAVVGRWSVSGAHPSAYVTTFEVGPAQAGPRRLVVEGGRALDFDGAQIVGPLALSLDLTGADAPAGVRPVNDYEMASRLSYFIWHSAPDRALLEAAAVGQLHTSQQITAQAKRMLADPRARRALRSYVDQWLRLDVLDTVERDRQDYPQFNAALVAAMKDETHRLFEDIIWTQRADLMDVFTSPRTWTTADLARLYGLAPTSTGVAPYDLSGLDERGGLLTQASVLTMTASGNTTSPTHRGLYVQTHFMCQHIGPRPATSPADVPQIGPHASKRERFAQHTHDPQCAYCHRKMDPIGFGLENFDAVGRYRSRDASGQSIDPAGRLLTARGQVRFDGPAELGQALHDSKLVEDCVVQNVYQYALGRPPRPEDVCDLRQVRASFDDGGRSYQALVLAVVTSRAFRYVRTHRDRGAGQTSGAAP